MNYEEFRAELLDALEMLKEPGTAIRCHTVEKNNGVRLEGISIRLDGECVAPTYYPKMLYCADLTRNEIRKMAEELLRESASQRFHHVSEEDIHLSIDQIVHAIYFRVVNYEANREYFETHPYRRFLDLACTFYFVPDFLKKEGGTVPVTNEQMKEWGLDIEHLFRIAAANTPRDNPPVFMPLIEAIEKTEDAIIRERADKDDDGRIFKPEYRDDPSVILTNPSGRFGASCVLYKHVFEQAAEEADSDLYIIPSSIHELILVPADGTINLADLNSTVRHVNRTALEVQDILSDHAYIYDKEEQVLTV